MSNVKGWMARRVLAGVALLDREYGPDWDLAVSLKALDMSSCIRCVLGQLFDDFENGMGVLGIRWGMAAANGFDRGRSDLGGYPNAYHALDRLWAYVIKARRAAREGKAGT